MHATKRRDEIRGEKKKKLSWITESLPLSESSGSGLMTQGKMIQVKNKKVWTGRASPSRTHLLVGPELDGRLWRDFEHVDEVAAPHGQWAALAQHVLQATHQCDVLVLTAVHLLEDSTATCFLFCSLLFGSLHCDTFIKRRRRTRTRTIYVQYGYILYLL